MAEKRKSRWRPSTILRCIESFETSTGVARVRTDAGDAYLKALGNKEGPHALVREFIGTALADWFGLQTFSYAIISITDQDNIRLGGGKIAQSGPAFVTKAEQGMPWGGSPSALKALENPEDIVKLVVLDTWLRNRDRHPPPALDRYPNRDNVFLSEELCSQGLFRLVAMDFTHCISASTMLETSLKHIKYWQDDQIYGFFREFSPYVNEKLLDLSLAKLAAFDKTVINKIINKIPVEWEVSKTLQDAIAEFITLRAGYLCEKMKPYMLIDDIFDI